MTIKELLKQKNLEQSLLIGFYGGGNYGDELLLEVLASMLKNQNVKHLTIAHQNPAQYAEFHHEFDYPRISMTSKPALLRAIFRHKTILIGGGGLWGLDMNFNTFALSVLLFLSRFFLGKKVYLLGVGYYNSTSRLGHIGAWFAGRSANWIVARDAESFTNFRKITRRVSSGQDITQQLHTLDLSPYAQDLQALEKRITVTQKTLFITLRRFRAHQQNSYLDMVEACIRRNTNKPIIVALMEPKTVDPGGYQLLKTWAKKYQNLQIMDFSYNPLALVLFFQKHHDQLVLIGPQFHLIITAALQGVAFLPIAYDNKVSELLVQLDGPAPIPIKQLTLGDMQSFIDKQYEGAG